MWLGIGVLIVFVVVLWVLMRLCLFLATVLLNMIIPDLRPLPTDVLSICSISGCDDLATRGTPDVTDCLNKKGMFVYLEGSKPSVYCARHSRRFSDYLGRYTHRVAISNHRLLAFDQERVTFRWKDYAHGGKQGKMTLAATEFLRRFFLHVLPRGFVRIRHFGFLVG